MTIRPVWLMSGCGLIGLFIWLAGFSAHFDVTVPLTAQPVIPFVLTLSSCGLLFLWLARQVPEIANSADLSWFLGVGLFCRLILLPSTPILETDFNRYLWDGALTANGINPYRYAPQQILVHPTDFPPKIAELARTHAPILAQINHPHIRTIYPPAAQAGFALAYWQAPGQLWAWRLILLLCDLVTALLLLKILKGSGQSPAWLALYWWNPLVIKEIFNSGHMDGLLFPFVLGGLWLLTRRRHLAATILLAIAAGIKLWPALLLPLVLKDQRPFWSKRNAFYCVIFGLIGLIWLLPILAAGFGDNSAFVTYPQKWQNNDSIFRLIVIFSHFCLEIAGLPIWHDQLLARGLTAAVVLGLTGWITFCRADLHLYEQALGIIAGLYLFSPTQFPWYATWFMPLLAVVRQPALLLLTALLPLYYLRYYLEPRGLFVVFENLIIALEFLPVWGLLIWQWMRGKTV